jgi:CO/xanthine dehydrogenase FAD-binding subunit
LKSINLKNQSPVECEEKMEITMTRESLKTELVDGKKYIYAGLDATLESVFQFDGLPEIYCETLRDGINWHVRSELSIERSILSPGSTYPWVATLMAVGAEVIFPDGAKKSVAEFMKQRKNASGAPVGVLLPAAFDKAKMCYQAIRPTPAALPTISVFSYLEMNGDVIENARIATTGTWKNKLALVNSAVIMVGKKLTKPLIDEVIEGILQEIEPQTNFQAGEEYRREMAKTLTRRSLSACMESEVS